MDLQNTKKWYKDRLCYITCSQLYRLKTAGAFRAYINELVDERQGIQKKNISNYYTDRGHGLEPIACKLYEKINSCKAILTGFIKHPSILWFGGSPDALIGDDGVLEIKCFTNEDKINKIKAGNIPVEIMLQIQGLLLVTDRKWCDLVIFMPQYKDPKDSYYVTRIYVNEDIQDQIKIDIQNAVNAIYEELYNREYGVK